MRRKLLTLGLVLTLAVVPTLAEESEEGFTPLVEGDDLSGFGFVLKAEDADPKETWEAEDGVVRCTGKPNGYFYTKKSYSNYVLRFDFRYPENAGNSGYLIHITGDHKVWPKCIEVQGMYDQAGLIFAIGGAKGPDNRQEQARKDLVLDSRKPHQEWNSLEIISQDGKITAKLNGTTVGEGEYDLTEGPIGFQSEGAPIEFRNMRIKVLD